MFDTRKYPGYRHVLLDQGGRPRLSEQRVTDLALCSWARATRKGRRDQRKQSRAMACPPSLVCLPASFPPGVDHDDVGSRRYCIDLLALIPGSGRILISHRSSVVLMQHACLLASRSLVLSGPSTLAHVRFVVRLLFSFCGAQSTRSVRPRSMTSRASSHFRTRSRTSDWNKQGLTRAVRAPGRETRAGGCRERFMFTLILEGEAGKQEDRRNR